MLPAICNKNLHSLTNLLADFCSQFCLTKTIVEPTRVTNTSKTLIDIIRPERWATSGTLQLGMSDHDLVYVVRKQRLLKSKAKVIALHLSSFLFIPCGT